MRSTKLLIPEQVAEEVAVIPLANVEQRCDVSCVKFVTMKRFNEVVNFVPCMTPTAFRDTVICYKDSTRKRFKSQTLYEPRVKPRMFSDTLIVFPKRPQRSFVTCIDYHMDECRRWFKTSMEFKALTYTTSKIISPDQNGALESEAESDLSETCGTCSSRDELPVSPGASQIYLPRWEKDVTELNNGEQDYNRNNNNYNQQQQLLVNGDLLQNELQNGFI